MSEAWIQIITAGIGTFGFCMFSHVRKKHLFTASLGGMLGWAIYLWVYDLSSSLFLGSLISAMAAYVWSEIMARIMKAPVTIFLLPGIIPLLPGSFLYYTTLALLDHQMAQFQQYGADTVIAAMGIACGVVIASIVASYVITTTEHIKHRHKKSAS